MQEMIRELGARFDEMFAVIQHEQRLFAAQIVREGVEQWNTLQLAYMERGGDCRGNIGWIRQLRERDQPNAIFPLQDLLCRHLQAKPCLARPAGTGKTRLS